MTSPREWLRNILSDDGGLPSMPIGRYSLHLTHTAPDGAVTSYDFPRIAVGADDYVRAQIVTEDDNEDRIDVSPTRYVPPVPTAVRIVLTGRLEHDEPTDATYVLRAMPPAPTRAEVIARHQPWQNTITEDISTCDCDPSGGRTLRFDRDADGNRLKDDVPVRLWSEHVDAALRKAGL